MHKRKVSLPVILGIVLILGSVCLVAVFHIRMYVSTQRNQTLVRQMTALLPDRTPGAAQAHPDAVMPILEIDGMDYVGLLELPTFDVSLPMANQWSGSMLSPNVGRFWGSAYDDTLVIGGPDYPGEFDFCDAVELGTPVTVTDTTGVQFFYTVVRVDRSKDAETQWLTETEFDLTLFCRDMYSMEYIAVRCELVGS